MLRIPPSNNWPSQNFPSYTQPIPNQSQNLSNFHISRICLLLSIFTVIVFIYALISFTEPPQQPYVSPSNCYSAYSGYYLIQAYLILLFLALLHFADTTIFTNWRFVATLLQASLSVPFFQQHLLTSSQCHILVILTIFQTFSLLLYLLGWSVTSDFWCY